MIEEDDARRSVSEAQAHMGDAVDGERLRLGAEALTEEVGEVARPAGDGDLSEDGVSTPMTRARSASIAGRRSSESRTRSEG